MVGKILAFNKTFIYSFIYSCYSRRFGLVRIIKLFLLVNRKTQHHSLSDLYFFNVFLRALISDPATGEQITIKDI